MTLQLTPAARTYFGYFAQPDHTTPAYDPGPDAPCPFCGQLLAGEPLCTSRILLFDEDAPGATLSLFYRTHRRCMDQAPEAQRDHKEHELLGLLAVTPPAPPAPSTAHAGRRQGRPLTLTLTLTLTLPRAGALLARALRRHKPPAAAG